ncbi:MAG: sigma-70 family RNA polymerase sigma factor [Pseudonocardiales bacterium]
MSGSALPPLAAPSLAEGCAALRASIGVLLRAEPVSKPTPSGARARPRPVPTPGPGRARRKPPEQGPGDVWAVVERAQAGDAEAFGQLYDRYVNLVFRYIHFRVGSRAQAEDLTSETFTRALRRICSVSWQGRDFGAWLVTIARNLIADHYKSSRYRLEISTADMIEADQPQEGPENDVLDAMTTATLLEAVKKLNAEQQECIVLRFLQGMSVTETGQAMGKNDGAIKALQYRAVRSLGRLLPSGFLR